MLARRPPIPARKRLPFDVGTFLAKVGLPGTLLEYREGQIVFLQGDPAKDVFYIQKGGIKLMVLSHRGKEAVVATLIARDFFGEGCLAGQRLRVATATAIVPSCILRIEGVKMIRALHEHHAFSDFFIRYALSRNIRVGEDLVDQLFNSSEKRLARALLLLARYGNVDKPETVIPKVNQQALAEMIGTTRERVNFFMNKFRRLGFIDYDPGLQVHSSLLSVVLHG